MACLLVTMAVSMAACGGDEPGAAPDAGVTVVAATTIWGDVAASVVGEHGTVEVIVPVGADPHDYRPSARQVAQVQEADLVVVNGLGLEDGLTDVVDGLEADGVRVWEAAESVEPLPFGGDDTEGTGAGCGPVHDGDDQAEDHQEEGQEGDGHEAGCDPHVWMDPTVVAKAVGDLAAELESIAPGVADWSARAEEYAGELERLDQEIADLVEPIPPERRVLVTNHDALGYFAHRYGFEVVGTVVPGGSTLGEPSSAELSALVEVMRREGVEVLFAETMAPSRLAEAVAAELGGSVEVVQLYTDSLGEPGSEAGTYPGMLRADARLVAEALS